jgi:phosphoribosylformimino-5-aminoimidazole carboxamide ribotide isomerase
VVDMKNQRAVHAVAGNRAEYVPLMIGGGDPIALARLYIQHGVQQLYIADLDAISGHSIQTEQIAGVLEVANGRQVLIDIGWSGQRQDAGIDQIRDLAARYTSSYWIAATETMPALESLAILSALVGADRVLLGLDFRSAAIQAVEDLQVWIDEARAVKVAGAVVLDLVAVGRSTGPVTHTICQMVKRQSPTWIVYSGGGVRSARDVQSLLDAGCDRCLVATALHGIL